MKKDILIFIGDWPLNIIGKVKLFQYIEERFKCRLNKIDEFCYNTIINNCDIRFQFCFGSKDDLVWEERRKIRETDGAKIPLSIERLHGESIKGEEIYYFGFCGILNENHQGIFLPETYKEVLFEDFILKETSAKRAKYSKAIKFDNFFINILKGTKCSAITSNHVLSLRYVESKSEDALIKIAKEIAKRADIVEMEGYEILNLYGQKFKGAFCYGSDGPGNKNKMLGNTEVTLNTDYSQFISTSLISLQEICK